MQIDFISYLLWCGNIITVMFIFISAFFGLKNLCAKNSPKMVVVEFRRFLLIILSVWIILLAIGHIHVMILTFMECEFYLLPSHKINSLFAIGWEFTGIMIYFCFLSALIRKNK